MSTINMNLPATLPKPRSKGVVVPPSNAAPAKTESLATMSLPPRSQPGPAAPGTPSLTTDDILGTLTAPIGNSSIVKEPAAASVQMKPAGQPAAPVGLPPLTAGKGLPAPQKNAQMPRDMSILGAPKVLGMGAPAPPRTHTMPLPQGMRKPAIQLNLKGDATGAGAGVPSVAEAVGNRSPSQKPAFATAKPAMEVVAKSPKKESKSDDHAAPAPMETGSDVKAAPPESKRATGNGKEDKTPVPPPKGPADELDELLKQPEPAPVAKPAPVAPPAAPAVKKSTPTPMDTGKDEKQKPASPKKPDPADASAAFRAKLTSGVVSGKHIMHALAEDKKAQAAAPLPLTIGLASLAMEAGLSAMKQLTFAPGKTSSQAQAVAPPPAVPAPAIDDMLGDVGVQTEPKPPAPKPPAPAASAAAPAALPKEKAKPKPKSEPQKPAAPAAVPAAAPAPAPAASAKASPKKAKPAAPAAPAAAEEKPPKPAAALRAVHVAKPEDLSADMETEEAPVASAKPAATVKASPRKAAAVPAPEADDEPEVVKPAKSKKAKRAVLESDDEEAPPATKKPAAKPAAKESDKPAAKPAAKAKPTAKPDPADDPERTESEAEAEEEEQEPEQEEQSDEESSGKRKGKSKAKGKSKGKGGEEKKAAPRRASAAIKRPKQWTMDRFCSMHNSGDTDLVATLHGYMENAGVDVNDIAPTIAANKKAGGAFNRLYDNLAEADKAELATQYLQYKHDRVTFLEEAEKRTAKAEARFAAEADAEEAKAKAKGKGKGEKQEAADDADGDEMDTSADSKAKPSKAKSKPKPKSKSSTSGGSSSSKDSDKSAKPKSKPAKPAAPAAKKPALSMQPAADETPAKASARQMLQMAIAEKEQVIKRAAALQQAIKSSQPTMAFMKVDFKKGEDGKMTRRCMFVHSTRGDSDYVRLLMSTPKPLDAPGGWDKLTAKEFLNAIRGRTENAGRIMLKRVSPSITGGPDIETQEWSFVFRDKSSWFAPLPDSLHSNSLQIACALYSTNNQKIKSMPELIERLRVVEDQMRNSSSAVPLVDTAVANQVAAYAALDKSHALPLDILAVHDTAGSDTDDFVAGTDEDTAAEPSPRAKGKAKSKSSSSKEDAKAAPVAAAGVVLDLTSDDAARDADMRKAAGEIVDDQENHTVLVQRTLKRLIKAVPQLATKYSESVLRAHQLIMRLAETDDEGLVDAFNQIAEMNPDESDWSVIAADVGHFAALLAWVDEKAAEAKVAAAVAAYAAAVAETKAAKAELASATAAMDEDEDEKQKSAEVDKQNRKLVDAAVKQGNVGLLVAAMNIVDNHDELATGPHMRVKLSETKGMEAAAKETYKREAQLAKEGKLKRERCAYTADSAKEAGGEDEEEEDTAVGSEADSEDTSDEDDLGPHYRQSKHAKAGKSGKSDKPSKAAKPVQSRKRKEAPAEVKSGKDAKADTDEDTEPAPKRQRTKPAEPKQEQEDEPAFEDEFADVKGGSEPEQKQPVGEMDTSDNAVPKPQPAEVAAKAVAAFKDKLTADTRERKLTWRSPLEDACAKTEAVASDLRELAPALKAMEEEEAAASAQQLQETAEDEPSVGAPESDEQALIRSHSEAVAMDGTQDPNASLEEATAMTDDNETVPASPEVVPVKKQAPKVSQPVPDPAEEVDYEDGPL